VSGKKAPPGGKNVKDGTRTRKRVPSTLDLVREGVQRFILNDLSLGEFQKTIRDAAEKGEMSSHPLTGIQFRRIVEEAISERNRTKKNSTKRQKPKVEETTT
jgi:hypothetical protein